MVRTIAALLVFALAIPSAATAQSLLVPPDQIAKSWIADTNPSSIERQRFVEREGIRPAISGTAATTADSPQASDRSWAGRHPVALGAIIGAAAGALWGGSLCWGRPPCGDGHGPLLVAFGAGLGAGIGAGIGVGVAISLGKP